MSKVEAEIENSVSLMDQIQALISPPVTRTSGDGKSEGLEERHPYYRRPGQGHNHDCCDACGEGGNLLCCDLCPASFHLTCHDPPLVEADIPSGLWSCHQCQYLAALKAKNNSNTDDTKLCNNKYPKFKSKSKLIESKVSSSQRRSKISLIDSSSRNAKTKLKRKASSDGDSDSKSCQGFDVGSKRSCGDGGDVSDSDSVSSEELCFSDENPMKVLIDAAAELNPTQFELPRELTVPIHFPGSDKPFSPKKVSSAHLVVGKKAEDQHVSEDGIVPEPVRFCFECRKTCRYAPLIACDYCPLFFHLDCLDPPLTYFPASRWMCPAHPEHFIDSTLLKSTSVTERVRLWQRFNKPFDHHTVAIEFYRKTHLRNIMYHVRQPFTNNNTVHVPEGVKAMYRNPPAAYPTLKTLMREEKFNRDNSLHSSSQPVNYDGPTQDEKDQWLLSLLAFQTDVARHLVESRSIKTEPDLVSEHSDQEISKNVLNSKNESEPTKIESDLNPSEVLSETICSKSMPNGVTVKSPVISSTQILCNGDATSCKDYNVPTSSETVESSLKSDSGKELLEDSCKTYKVPCFNSNGCYSKSLLESYLEDVNKLDRISDPTLASAGSCKLLENTDSGLVHILACQRLQQLSDKVCPSQVAFRKAINDSEDEWKVHTKARAILSPLTVLSAPSIPMILRTLTIGTDPEMDVCLTNYGHCDFVSSKHAAIFFDEGSLHYELLNYSEHGTVVDSVLYSCDVSDRPRPRINTRSRSNKEGIKVKRPTYTYVKASSDDEEEIKLDPLAGKVKKRWMNCKCHNEDDDSPSTKDSGWEGSALMNHGSQVSFGCLKFVFSISDFSPMLYIRDHNPIKDFLDDCKVIHSSRMIAKDVPLKKKQRSSSTSSSSSSSSTLSHSSKIEIESEESSGE